MSMSTSYVCDPYLFAGTTNGDAVIAGGNIWINNVDPVWMPDVNSICIDAISWCSDREAIESKVFAT